MTEPTLNRVEGAHDVAGRNKVKAVCMTGTVMPKGRLVARAHREAQCGGSVKLKAAKSSSSSAVANAARMANPDATGRDIAREVRHQRCTNGKVACSTSGSRPTGRVPKKFTAPEKVGVGFTSGDQVVTGTMANASLSMTGSEAGSCRVISGTEYMGQDDYQAKCSFKPEASPRKVALTSTGRGLRVSGTEVGHASSVTGTEAGGCRGVTGTEYLPADQTEAFCGTKPQKSPAKVSHSKTTRNQVVSGPSILPREGMTGLEVGAERTITGSQYTASTSAMAKKPTREARGSVMSVPTKSDVSHTASGTQVSGTNVNFNQPVTGDEAGYCQKITGNEYQSMESRRGRCNTDLAPTPRKVAESATFAGQRITGDRAGLGGKITGAEAGRCKSVTGSSYISLDVAETCDMPVQALKPDVFQRGFNAKPTTGNQPGPMGLTGAQRGACQVVSGTPYQGMDHTSSFCSNGMAAVAGESDYPVMINSYAGGPSIQQPIYSTPSYTLNQLESSRMGAPAAEIAKPSRLTGQGSNSGASITGDSWERNERVTGNEGRWAEGRNVSLRGQSMTPARNLARDYRPNTAAEIPMSPITGSSGNTSVGASVTVSGGARA
jgi:hypothetical protein